MNGVLMFSKRAIHRAKLCFWITFMVFYACNDDTSMQNNPTAEVYTAPLDICGEVAFQEKIGENLEQALDEIFRRKTESGLENIVLEPQQLREVRNSQDDIVDKALFVVIVIDSETGLKAHAWHEVIDEQGNLYIIHWCPD